MKEEDLYVGLKVKRIAQGNMADRYYNSVRDKICIITRLSSDSVYFKREDGGRLEFSRNGINYFLEVFDIAQVIHIGGE